MKVKPVIDALERRDIQPLLVHTGQHYDSEMSDVFFEELGLRQPDHHLGVGSGTHGEQVGRVIAGMEPLLDELTPDLVVVVGDVNSTLGAALVAAKSPAALAHVEAGLRSRDLTMPEEVNRIVTDRLSDLLFATSPEAVDNLVAEGRDASEVHLVGNTMIDTLLANVERARGRNVPARFELSPQGYGVITLHRPANVDEPQVLKGLLEAFTQLGSELPLVWPVHPRTRDRISAGVLPDGVILTEPMGYLDFIGLLSDARLVMTDSGGIQEETTVLGIACLTLRDNTERPITVTEGTNTVVGREAGAIVAEALRVLDEGVERRRPALWDGHAGDRIADVIVSSLGRSF